MRAVGVWVSGIAALAAVAVFCAPPKPEAVRGAGGPAGIAASPSLPAPPAARGDEVPAEPQSARGPAAPAPADAGPRAGRLNPAAADGLRFARGSAQPLPDGGTALDRVTALAHNSSAGFVVAGHTGAAGGPAFGRRLSLARAQAVRDALAARGIDPGRKRPRGEAAARPVGDPATAEGRACNRRVDFLPFPN